MLRIAPPARLDTNTKATALGPGLSEQLQNLDIRRFPGRTRRGPGMSRAVGVAGSSSTIVACGVFERRDCRKVLVDQSASGVVRAHVGTGYGAITPPCVGPIPQSVEAVDDEHGIQGGSFNAGDGVRKDGNGQAILAVGADSALPSDEPCDDARAGTVEVINAPASCPKSRLLMTIIGNLNCKTGAGVHVLCTDPMCLDHQLELEMWCL